MAANTSLNRQIIAAQYAASLGRTASAADIDAWLGTGQSIEDIATGIRTSPEAQSYAPAPRPAPAPAPRPAPAPAPTSSTSVNAAIQNAYQQYVGRPADAQELAYWSGTYSSQNPISQIVSNIATASRENVGQYTSIEDLYQDLLGRAPDASGLGYWTQQLMSPTSPGGAAITPQEVENFKTVAQQVQSTFTPEQQRINAPNAGFNINAFLPGGTETGYRGEALDPSQSTLSPNFADYVYRMLAKGEQAANLPFQEYTGQRFAGPSPLQLRAFSGIANLADPSAFAEAQRFMTMAGTNAGNTFYTPTTFTTGLGQPTGITSLPEVTGVPAGGTASAMGALPTVEQELSRFGVTPGWVGQVPSTAIPTTQTLQGAFPEEAASFADGGDVTMTGTSNTATAMPQTNPFQLGSVASYMSPYTGAVTDIAAREARRQADIGRTQEQARLAQAGAYGGSRQAIMEAERQRNLNQQIGDIATTGLQSAYDRAMKQRMEEAGLGMRAQELGEQSRQFGATFGLKGQELGLQAGQALGQLGTAQGQYGLNALNAMLNAGQVQQQLAQQPLDFGYQQFQESLKYPYQQASFMQSLLGGLPVQAAGYTPEGSQFAGGLQGLLAGLALSGGLKG